MIQGCDAGPGSLAWGPVQPPTGLDHSSGTPAVRRVRTGGPPMGQHASSAPAEPSRGSAPRPPRLSRRVKLTAIGTGATLAVAGAGVVMATGANAAVPAAAFAETSTWDGGYTGQYTITNTTPSAISSWTVVFSLPGGSTVDSLWNGTETAAGQTYTVANAGWNGSLAAGASTTFGFTVNGTGE